MYDIPACVHPEGKKVEEVFIRTGTGAIPVMIWRPLPAASGLVLTSPLCWTFPVLSSHKSDVSLIRTIPGSKIWSLSAGRMVLWTMIFS